MTENRNFRFEALRGFLLVSYSDGLIQLIKISNANQLFHDPIYGVIQEASSSPIQHNPLIKEIRSVAGNYVLIRNPQFPSQARLIETLMPNEIEQSQSMLKMFTKWF